MSVRRAGSRRSAPASASTRSRSSRSRRGPVRQSTTLRLLRASTRPILDQPDAGGRALRRSSLRGERSVAGPPVCVRAFRLTPATARCLAAGMRDPGRAERTRLRQREHFETLADEYAREAAVFDLHSESLFRRFLAVSAPPGRHLLEIGAGAGRYTLPLLRAGYRIDALDLSPRALARLEERARAEGLGDRLRTIAGDAERLDPGGAYDLVYGVHLLHHVADRVAMLASMRRAARRGGVVVCVEPNPLNPAWYAYLTLDRLRSWRGERGPLTLVPWALLPGYQSATRHGRGSPSPSPSLACSWLASAFGLGSVLGRSGTGANRSARRASTRMIRSRSPGRGPSGSSRRCRSSAICSHDRPPLRSR